MVWKEKNQGLSEYAFKTGVGMTVFIQNLSELGSDRSQDVAMSPWRLSIFVSQGNISKLADPTAGAGSHRADAK